MAGPINVEVRLKKDEATEKLIRRFTRKVKKEGILDEYRNNLYYEKPSVTRRRKKMNRKRIAQKIQKNKEAKYKD